MPVTAPVSARARDWLLAQLSALAEREAGPEVLDDDEYRVLRAERLYALRRLIVELRRQW